MPAILGRVYTGFGDQPRLTKDLMMFIPLFADHRNSEVQDVFATFDRATAKPVCRKWGFDLGDHIISIASKHLPDFFGGAGSKHVFIYKGFLEKSASHKSWLALIGMENHQAFSNLKSVGGFSLAWYGP